MEGKAVKDRTFKSDEDLGDESFEFEGDSTVDGYREELSPEDTSTLDLEGTLTDERPKSRPDTPSTERSSSTDNTDTASRTGNSSGKMKAKQKRPWSLHAKKQGKDEIDLALLKTANSIAEQVNKTSESDNRSQELNEGGVRKVRKPQNRTKNNKKPQYRIEIYRNTETTGCRRQDLQSFYPLKIRPAV